MNLKKGSKAARDFMARLRAMKGGGKKVMRKNPTKQIVKATRTKAAYNDYHVTLSDGFDTRTVYVHEKSKQTAEDAALAEGGWAGAKVIRIEKQNPTKRARRTPTPRGFYHDDPSADQAMRHKRASELKRLRAGYTFKIGNREMGVTGVSQDEAAALAKKIAKMEGKKVEVFEGKF